MILTLRRVELADHRAVGELLAAAYAPSGMHTDDPYYERLRDVAARDTEAEVWVAADESGEVVGTVTWCPTGSPLREIAADDEAEFRMLAVAPDHQGRGIASAMVHWVIDRASAEGLAAVVLCSAEWMTTAHRLYEREGFFRIPSRDWSPRPDVHLLAYARPASAPCGC